jgi:cryptochrome
LLVSDIIDISVTRAYITVSFVWRVILPVIAATVLLLSDPAIVVVSMSSSSSAAHRTGNSAIHWFRKGLRLHNNPALVEACAHAAAHAPTSRVYPLFILDPNFARPDVVGINRYSFLLQSLKDLDSSLRGIGSRLYVVKGKPSEQLSRLVSLWDVSLLTFESDTEPYALLRDESIKTLLGASSSSSSSVRSVRVSTHCSHTLHDPSKYLALGKGKIPQTQQSFQKLFEAAGPLREAEAAPDTIPGGISDADLSDDQYDVPSLAELGYEGEATTAYPGGETEALRRLQQTVEARPAWAATFEKPNTPPNSLEPSTTVLSPYLKFGCLSPLKFYNTLSVIYAANRQHSKPPVSLHGQLLWREFFYACSATTPNFGRMEGNPYCKQIPWERNPAVLLAWKEARTGYPFIDAIMTELRQTGWIHHLARHAVACFLTRGDLWQHWEEVCVCVYVCVCVCVCVP